MEIDTKPGRKRMEIRCDDPLIVRISPSQSKCKRCGSKLIMIRAVSLSEEPRTVSYCAGCGPKKKNLGEWFD